MTTFAALFFSSLLLLLLIAAWYHGYGEGRRSLITVAVDRGFGETRDGVFHFHEVAGSQIGTAVHPIRASPTRGQHELFEDYLIRKIREREDEQRRQSPPTPYDRMSNADDPVEPRVILPEDQDANS